MNLIIYSVIIIMSVILGIGIGIHGPQAFTVDFSTPAAYGYDEIRHVGCASDSMGVTLPCNSVMYLVDVYAGDPLKIGDIHVYENGTESVVHRLIGCVDDNCTKLIFKGDNNKVADPIIQRNKYALYHVEMIRYD